MIKILFEKIELDSPQGQEILKNSDRRWRVALAIMNDYKSKKNDNLFYDYYSYEQGSLKGNDFAARKGYVTGYNLCELRIRLGKHDSKFKPLEYTFNVEDSDYGVILRKLELDGKKNSDSSDNSQVLKVIITDAKTDKKFRKEYRIDEDAETILFDDHSKSKISES